MTTSRHLVSLAGAVAALFIGPICATAQTAPDTDPRGSYSLALFHLGQLYMNKGERELTVKAFQAYLHDSPAARNADQVRKLIAMLR